MPWDYEDDDTCDWINKHLESRLRLYYDIKNGIIPRSTAEHIKALIAEARRLQAQREQIESELGDEDIQLDTVDSAKNLENEKLEKLMKMHVRILQISSEVKLLENPLVRNVMLKQQNELSPVRQSEKPEIWLVLREGKIEEYLEFLSSVKDHYANKHMKLSNTLSWCLQNAKPKDTVILSKGRHVIKSVGFLENGGTLKGIYNPEETMISSLNEDVMMDFSGPEIVLENLTIDSGFSQCGILVRSGKLILKKCKIIGDGESSTHQGIIVLAGSQLEMIHCELTRFCTAVVGNSGASITMKDCEIYNVSNGIKIYDNCTVKVENTCFRDCSEFGFCMETDTCLKDGNQKCGNFDVLQM